MSLFIFARLEPKPGMSDAVRARILAVLAPTRQEPGCVRARAFESVQGPPCFHIHSEWVDEAAFDHHLTLPHTVRFVEQVEPLITHPLRAIRSQPFD